MNWTHLLPLICYLIFNKHVWYLQELRLSESGMWDMVSLLVSFFSLFFFFFAFFMPHLCLELQQCTGTDCYFICLRSKANKSLSRASGCPAAGLIKLCVFISGVDSRFSSLTEQDYRSLRLQVFLGQRCVDRSVCVGDMI